MSEPTVMAISEMQRHLQNAIEYGSSFRFQLPEKGLSLRSVAIQDGAPKLNFEAAVSTNTPTITEEDVATVVRLVDEGKRPEFFYIAIPPGHPFHGRQYKYYSPQWLRGTSVGELLAEVDWEMKCLTIGTKTNDAKTEFWEASKTSNLEGILGTSMNFPHSQKSGSVKMSCKSVKVEKTEHDLVFIGEPKMQIIDDRSPAYSKYITENLDSVAHHDQPLFLKMQELMKLILAIEFFKERGVKFDKEWYTEHTANKNHQFTPTQAIEKHDSAVDFEAMLEYLPQEMKKQISHQTKTGIKFGMPGSESTMAVSVNDYNMLYDEFDPKQPLICEDDLIVPDVDTWSELYKETVQWPQVWALGKRIHSACGGITSSHIPTSHVPVGTSTKSTTRMDQKLKHKGPYECSRETLSVSSSTSASVSRCPPPSDMIPKHEKPPQAPKRNVGPQSRTAMAKPGRDRRMYGWHDESSMKVCDDSGNEVFKVESMKIAKQHRSENGEIQRAVLQLPLVGLSEGQSSSMLDDDGTSDKGDGGCFSPPDTGSRFTFCSPIGSDDEMD